MATFLVLCNLTSQQRFRWRGKMLYQVCKTKMFLADIKHSKEQTDKEVFLAGIEIVLDEEYLLTVVNISEMRESIAGLEDVVECLKHEPDTSSEFRIKQLAEASIYQSMEILSMISALG